MKMTIINGRKITLEDEERQECEVWTRVMGYYRPVSAFNRGKKAEFKERKMYGEKRMVNLYNAGKD